MKVGAAVDRPAKAGPKAPPAVARRFVEDLRAFRAAPNAIRHDEIAACQLHALKQHYNGKRRLSDIEEMFARMRGPA